MAAFDDLVHETLATAKEDWLFNAADNAILALDESSFKRIEILVSRLDEEEMIFKCLNSLKSIFSNTGGGGWSSNIDVAAEAARIKPLWSRSLKNTNQKSQPAKNLPFPIPLSLPKCFPSNSR